jgi:hypothetical protein
MPSQSEGIYILNIGILLNNNITIGANESLMKLYWNFSPRHFLYQIKNRFKINATGSF